MTDPTPTIRDHVKYWYHRFIRALRRLLWEVTSW